MDAETPRPPNRPPAPEASTSVSDSTWRGWLPTEDHCRWVDLTRELNADVERVAHFPAPSVQRVQSLDQDRLNVTRIDMVVHTGTHLDAPSHFIAGGPSVAEIPLDRLTGSGVVWQLDCEPGALIDVDDLESARPQIRPGDMVLLDTGFAARWGSPSYRDNPSLSVEAAQWLVDQKVTLLGVDFATPDLAVARRPADFTWPVHHVLLQHGVLIVEHLVGLDALAGRRVEVVVGALPITASDGAPARVLARAQGAPGDQHPR